MDNQTHQDLEIVYNYLHRQSTLNIDEMSVDLLLSQTRLTALFSELNNMGLAISCDSNGLSLRTSSDKIDAEFIKLQIQKTCNKTLIYNFISESTNQLAQNNQQDSIYICDYQSQGRGRLAKKWVTPLGQSIAISISHRFDFGLKKLTGLNIAVGVAIIQTLKQCGGKDMGLKWPNDIISPTGKVAGILIEASGNLKSCRAIIGIGINWNIRQELLNNIDQPCRNAEISKTSRSQFIIHLIGNLEKALTEFSTNQLANIQSTWQQHDVYLDKNINVLQGKKTIPAVYKGINQLGLLRVKINNELTTVASGEVSIRLRDA